MRASARIYQGIHDRFHRPVILIFVVITAAMQYVRSTLRHKNYNRVNFNVTIFISLPPFTYNSMTSKLVVRFVEKFSFRSRSQGTVHTEIVRNNFQMNNEKRNDFHFTGPRSRPVAPLFSVLSLFREIASRNDRNQVSRSIPLAPWQLLFKTTKVSWNDVT